MYRSLNMTFILISLLLIMSHILLLTLSIGNLKTHQFLVYFQLFFEPLWHDYLKFYIKTTSPFSQISIHIQYKAKHLYMVEMISFIISTLPLKTDVLGRHIREKSSAKFLRPWNICAIPRLWFAISYYLQTHSSTFPMFSLLKFHFLCKALCKWVVLLLH